MLRDPSSSDVNPGNVPQKITTLYTKCNAALIAAAKLKAATTKYNTLFPCTTLLTAATFDPEGLDTCSTVSGATCPTTCASALLLLPTSCLAQVKANVTWCGANHERLSRDHITCPN